MTGCITRQAKRGRHPIILDVRVRFRRLNVLCRASTSTHAVTECALDQPLDPCCLRVKGQSPVSGARTLKPPSLRGLFTNAAQLPMPLPFALSNRWMVRRAPLNVAGEVRP